MIYRQMPFWTPKNISSSRFLIIPQRVSWNNISEQVFIAMAVFNDENKKVVFLSESRGNIRKKNRKLQRTKPALSEIRDKMIASLCEIEGMSRDELTSI